MPAYASLRYYWYRFLYSTGYSVQHMIFFSIRFYTDAGQPLDIPAPEVIEKFRKITGITDRRYASANDMTASDLGAIAARNAIEDSGIDPETIDQVIVAHNFGDTLKETIQMDAVPSLASRIKHAQLGIVNPQCIAYDILFGCPGWIQGRYTGRCFFQSRAGKKMPGYWRRNVVESYRLYTTGTV